ncbi:SULTR2 [Symbiodinium necroappetens]|uniref:SULTR2 protein n=1 Tax=Symbiodinium necroappetens TaxID=1628268 RepID=A0A813C8Z3_9DINO|nr:SULTR2 [Symbiodinium necroappetens]
MGSICSLGCKPRFRSKCRAVPARSGCGLRGAAISLSAFDNVVAASAMGSAFTLHRAEALMSVRELATWIAAFPLAAFVLVEPRMEDSSRHVCALWTKWCAVLHRASWQCLPQLCEILPGSGTMRYVHLECLNMWRASSANPQSAYKCDQCNFQYSFQRALYASILRSALVLHSITLLLFAGTVLLCGYVCYYVDWLQNGDGTTEVLSQDLVDHFVNVSGLDDIDKEEFRRLADGLNSFTFGGISLAHILNGIMMVGLSGCVSSSIFFFGSLGLQFDKHERM